MLKVPPKDWTGSPGRPMTSKWWAIMLVPSGSWCIKRYCLQQTNQKSNRKKIEGQVQSFIEHMSRTVSANNLTETGGDSYLPICAAPATLTVVILPASDWDFAEKRSHLLLYRIKRLIGLLHDMLSLLEERIKQINWLVLKENRGLLTDGVTPVAFSCWNSPTSLK